VNKYPSYTKILTHFFVINQYCSTFLAIGIVAMPLAIIAPVMIKEYHTSA